MKKILLGMSAIMLIAFAVEAQNFRKVDKRVHSTMLIFPTTLHTTVKKAIKRLFALPTAGLQETTGKYLVSSFRMEKFGAPEQTKMPKSNFIRKLNWPVKKSKPGHTPYLQFLVKRNGQSF